MKRRIRKKKLKQNIDRLDKAIIRNSELKKKEIKKNKPVTNLFVGIFLPLSSFALKMDRGVLKNKLKRGDY
ncbi:MAG: hypothetical protein HDR41_00630 [Lactobacillus sp.]|nr:hypothetical protein [Lactobacillus sp.]